MNIVRNELYPNSVSHEGGTFMYKIDPIDGYVVWRKLTDEGYSIVDNEEAEKLTCKLSEITNNG